MKNFFSIYFYLLVLPLQLFAMQEQLQPTLAGSLFMTSIKLEKTIKDLSDETQKRQLPSERLLEFQNDFRTYSNQLQKIQEFLKQTQPELTEQKLKTTQQTVGKIDHNLEIAEKEISQYQLLTRPRPKL